MKTHELARALRQLSELLKSGPNIQTQDAAVVAAGAKDEVKLRGIAVNLATLASLSRLSKKEWQAVIEHYQLPVIIKPSDSTRDLLGRLLSHLEKNTESLERLKREAEPTASEASPELMRALKVLLKG